MKTRLLMLLMALLTGLWVLQYGLAHYLFQGQVFQPYLAWKNAHHAFFSLGCISLVIITGLVLYRVFVNQQQILAQLQAAGSALRESRARFQKVTANLPGVAFQLTIKPDGTWEFSFISEKCRELFGVDADALQRDVGLGLGFVHPDDLTPLVAGIEEAVRLMQPWSWDGRFLVCGTCKWMQGFAQPERQPDGRILFDGLMIDITDLKHAEQALSKSRQMLQLVLDTIPSTVFWKDRDSVYLGCNRVFAKDAGLTNTADVVHKTDLDFAWKEHAPRLRADDLKVMETNTPKIGYDEPLIKADHLQHWLRTSKAPMRDGMGQVIGMLGTYEDVTERKQAEDQLRASLREKEILLREIHHRVKNNLQVISSLLSLQSQHIADPRDRRLFQESQSRVRTMALIHETLYRSQDLAQTDFAEYLHTLADELLHAFKTRDVRIRLEIEEHIRLSIEVAIPCALIIHELVTNALKYAFGAASQGAMESRPAAEILIAFHEEPGIGYWLAVSDNGCGLPEHVESGKSDSLGWSLIMALTEQVHGRLEIDRHGGTAVSICFPKENDKTNSTQRHL